MHAPSEPDIEKPCENHNDVSISDAETQSGSEDELGDNDNDNDNNDVRVVDPPDSNNEPNNDVEIEPAKNLGKPHTKNKHYDKRDFVARKNGKERDPWVQKPIPFPCNPYKGKDEEEFESFVEMIRPVFLRTRLTDILKMPMFAKYMKDIITTKRKILENEIATMLSNYYFDGGVPKKLLDPSIPTIP